MAKRRLSDFDFKRSGCHIAAVGAEVGGPANQRPCLIYKGVNPEGNKMEMIEKSAAAEMVQKAVEPIQKALDEANAKLAAFEQAEAEAKVAIRKQALKDAMGADNTEVDAKLEVLKSVDDAVFEMVLKGLKTPEVKPEMEEMGSSNATRMQDVKEESAVAKILKARYNIK